MRNLTITGDLILAEEIGEGDVHLEGVTVDGSTLVNGGGENSVYFTDSVLATVIVNKNTGAVRIVAQGSTRVYEVQLETPARVVEDHLDEEAKGFEDIIVSEAMQPTGDYQVQLEGEFETINSRASNIRIDVGEATNIQTLILNAVTQVLGTGTIRTAEINAVGSVLSQRPQNVVLDIDGSVTIEDEEITESFSEAATTSINTVTANQGSVSVKLENFIADLTVSDFDVTATVDGHEYELQNLLYHPNQNRFTFSPLPLTDNIEATVEITVASNSNKVTGDAKTASFEIGTGFAGRITDIQGVGIPELTIKFREGSGTQEGDIVGEATTDRYGYYSVNLPAGMYTGEFSAPGYVTTYMLGTAASDVFLTDQNETAIRAAASDEVKIMLSWDKDPSDLDSHLTGPGADGTPFHIAYYNKKEIEDGFTYVDLDWDDVNSYGPETTTIRKLIDGEYRFYIHHFSGQSTLRLSGAQVEVFKGNSNTPDHTFNVPTGEGNEPYWVVFDLKVSDQGETIEIKPINIMADNENQALQGNGLEETNTSEELAIQEFREAVKNIIEESSNLPDGVSVALAENENTININADTETISGLENTNFFIELAHEGVAAILVNNSPFIIRNSEGHIDETEASAAKEAIISAIIGENNSVTLGFEVPYGAGETTLITYNVNLFQ